MPVPSGTGWFYRGGIRGVGYTISREVRLRRKSHVFRQGSGILDSLGGIIGSVTPPDVIAPITAVVSQTVTKVSRITGKTLVAVTFNGNEDWQQYQVRLVAADTDTVTMGTLVQNGPNDQSFETAGSPGGIGWTTSAGASQPQPALSFVATGATVGARALQVASNGNIINGAGNFQQAISPKIPISPGDMVSVTADMNISVGNGPKLQIGIQFFDANSTFLAQTQLGVGNAVGPYYSQFINGVAPANTASFAFVITLNGIPATGATATGSMTAQVDNVRYQIPGNQNFTVTIDEASIETAGGIEGNNLLKVFLQDMAGNWSN